jgi:hypothetical protein
MPFSNPAIPGTSMARALLYGRKPDDARGALRKDPENLGNRLCERDDDLGPGDDAAGKERPAFLAVLRICRWSGRNFFVRMGF